jgi:hypothetical protein
MRLAAFRVLSDEERRLAFFTPRDIEDALSTVPAQFDVFDRRGRLAFTHPMERWTKSAPRSCRGSPRWIPRGRTAEPAVFQLVG